MMPLIAIFSGFIAGWIVNYFADVLPTQRKMGRPVCDHCGTVRSWKDYFLLLPCQNCQQKQSKRTVIVPFVMIALSLAALFYAPIKLGYWFSLLLLTYFTVVFVIDVEYRLILHIVSLIGAAFGLITGILLHGIINSLIGGLAGLLIMLLFYLVGILFARYRAKKLGVDDDEEALGFGDVLLAGVIGLMLGWPLITTGLVIAILSGGVVSVVMILVLSAMRRFESMNVFIAYGPYLILGAMLMIFFPQISIFFTGR